MRFGIRASNALERVALALGLVPQPLLDTQIAYTMARAIMAGVELGIFEALAKGPCSAETIAQRGNLDLRATRALIDALVGCDYLHYDSRAARYALRPVARRWLISSSKHAIDNKMRLQRFEWEAVGKLEDFVRTGEHLDWHGDLMNEAQWGHYQRGMADLGRIALPEILRQIPIPRHARSMLDIGGSGGTYSAAFVRARPGLVATIFDLPAAVPHAGPLVKAHGLGARLLVKAGNVLEDDLGEARYDFVFMANVAHHFNEAQNLAVAEKSYRALRPGGVYCILDIERRDRSSPSDQIGALLNLYFAMTSQVGTWAVSDMTRWLRQSGFDPQKPIRPRTAPGGVLVWGRR